jgi:uncharacterized membrane protein YhfC
MRTLWIAAACVAVCLIPLVSGLVWRKRYEKMRPVWMGVMGFFAFAAIAEMLFVMICLSALGPVSRALNASPVRLVVFSCLCAAVFEEVGRFLIYRSGLAHCKGRSIATGYAIGHFGAEILILTVWPLLSKAAADFGAARAGITVYERLVACAGHTALSVLVWYAFSEKKPGALLAAIVLHAVCDTPVGMLRYGLIGQTVSEICFGAFVAILCIIALQCWKKMPAGAIIEVE